MVAPLLFVLVLGCIEFGRAFMCVDLLANAARTGCRTGVLPGKATSDITTDVNSALAPSDISGATVIVTVNGNAADASTAVQGDQIAVSVSIPYNHVTWLPSSWFLGGTTLSETVVMRRE